MRNSILLIIALAMVFSSETLSAFGDDFPKTIVDAANKTVTIQNPINTIVPVAGTNSVDVLRALDSADKIVGTCKAIHAMHGYFSEFDDAADIAGLPLDFEKIKQLNPDLLLVYTGHTCGYQNESDWEQFRANNTTIVHFRFTGYGENKSMIQQIKDLGYILGKDEKANEFVEFIQNKTLDVQKGIESIPEDKRPRVYIMGNTSLFKTYNGDHPISQLIELAGGRNIAADIQRDLKNHAPVIDAKWLNEQDPEIIVSILGYKLPCGYETDDPSAVKSFVDRILGNSSLTNVSAIKNNRVYCVQTRLTSGPARVIGLEYLAKIFHPNIFGYLDPEAVHQEYLTRFMHMDYDLNSHGIHVYPPLAAEEGKLQGMPDRYYENATSKL